MRRRFIPAAIIIIIAHIALMVFGVMQYMTISETIDDCYAYVEEYKKKSEYRSLSAVQQRCYGAIYTALTERSDTDEIVIGNDGASNEQIGMWVTLPALIGSENAVKEVFRAFSRDNPQFFYVSNHYYLKTVTVLGRSLYTDIGLYYNMDAEERDTACLMFEDIVQEILDMIPNTKDEYLIELRLHDELLRRCTYLNEEAEKNANGRYQHKYDAYGALVEGHAVCEGYARAMQVLLTRAGIKSSLVSGKKRENNEGHIWNLVTINGKQYYLDATWNDVGNQPQHTFFNCTTNQILRTHTIDAPYKDVICGSVTDNYHVRNGLYFDTFDEEALAEIVADRIVNFVDFVELRFSPGAYELASEFFRDPSRTHSHVNDYLLLTNYTLWDYALYCYDDSHTICLQKKVLHYAW